MPTCSFYTLGCRVNQYETEAIREELFSLGFTEAKKGEIPDLTLVNTCAVTGESVRKDKQIIRRALRNREKKPDSVLCVCGCYTQGALADDPLLACADLVFGNTRKHEIAVISGGRIIEQGHHNQLIEQDGMYAALYKLQFREDNKITSGKNRCF